MAPRRPILRYHGGKWRLAHWIISHFPPHRIYTEAFGGGGSVLLRKERSYAEVYNDLDGEIVNVFRMARDHGAELLRALELTPFSRSEFLLSYETSRDPLEQARRTIVRSYQGFGSAAVCGEISGFRANSHRSHTTPAHDWRNYPDCMRAIIERLRGVVIEQRDALDLIERHDASDALHYIDPPYVHSTRSEKRRNTVTRKAYKFEMDDAAHVRLAERLRQVKGMVIVSGYPTALYEQLYAGWRREIRASHADGARDRVECIWISPNTPATQQSLLGKAA